LVKLKENLDRKGKKSMVNQAVVWLDFG